MAQGAEEAKETMGRQYKSPLERNGGVHDKDEIQEKLERTDVSFRGFRPWALKKERKSDDDDDDEMQTIVKQILFWGSEYITAIPVANNIGLSVHLKAAKMQE